MHRGIGTRLLSAQLGQQVVDPGHAPIRLILSAHNYAGNRCGCTTSARVTCLSLQPGSSDRARLGSLAIFEIEPDLVDIAPAPAFRRVIAFDDGVAGGVEMRGGVAAWGIVAAAHVAAGAAQAQM